MTRIRMVGLALSGVFAVMIVASASALAAENPILVNSSGAAFTGTATSKSVRGINADAANHGRRCGAMGMRRWRGRQRYFHDHENRYRDDKRRNEGDFQWLQNSGREM